ncbi:MAG: GxxExxY protein [Pontiellaceae bacterium]|nr:GxxExxY protein [Pontiellaceae bacterium]
MPIHAELSYAIVGAAMEVHSKLGTGWDEETYHVALLHALSRQGIKAGSKLRGVLKNHDLIADEFELDILVEDTIILELKHILSPFAPAHHFQLINYLKFWNKNLGILINFGLERLQYKRIPFTPISGVMNRDESWDTLNNNIAKQIDLIFNSLFSAYGLGYGAETYKGLFRTECATRIISCGIPSVTLQYEGACLGEKQIGAFCLDSNILISITARNEQSSATDMTRLLSYMRQTGHHTGLLANFGKTSLDLRLLTQ